MIEILKNRGLIRVSGGGAEGFLHGQLANEVRGLGDGDGVISAYCQHQGKVIALVWVLKMVDDFYLSMPQDLVDVVLGRLQMFVLMADVKITEVGADFVQLGADSADGADIKKLASPTFKLNSQQFVILANQDKVGGATFTADFWEQTAIEMMLPEVFLATNEKFVPQMLNLDIDEVGVNFKKGCYPGQEVVARLHYLGKAKRRLYRFEAGAKIEVGDELIVAGSKSAKASGIVVRVANIAGKSICLATLEVGFKDGEIRLKSATGLILTRIKK